MARPRFQRGVAPHHLRFPYIAFHGQGYPLVPLTLRHGRRTVNTFALIDSGASISVFRPEIARALSLRLGRRRAMRLGTASGNLAIDTVRVGARIGDEAFPMEIGFLRRAAARFNIIGRADFFARFHVCFNESRKTVVLIPVRGRRTVRRKRTKTT